MKRNVSFFIVLTFSICFMSSACTNQGNVAEPATKLENTLQSVSYIQDTIGRDLQEILSAFNEMNKAIDSIGYPDAGYKIWVVQPDSSEVSLMIEGFWPDQAIYDEIHNHQLYIDTWEKGKFSWEGLVSVEYHRFTLLK